MKERILQIMKKENMTQQEFAKAIEVSPASLSNIFNGRTNPTNNHVSAIHRHFPNININWLMFGEGNMYASTGGNEDAEGGMKKEEVPVSPASSNENEGLLFPDIDTPLSKESPLSSASPVRKTSEPTDFQMPVIREIVKYIDKPQRKITEIRIFFDDGTYEVFGGN